ncbi:unnamed protein product [Bubo scandiacus]
MGPALRVHYSGSRRSFLNTQVRDNNNSNSRKCGSLENGSKMLLELFYDLNNPILDVAAGGNLPGSWCKIPHGWLVLLTSTEPQGLPKAAGLELGHQSSQAQHFEDCKPKLLSS